MGFVLPAELAAEWVVAGPVGRPGNEAFVAAVDPVAGGARRVVKVYYHPQAVPDEQAVTLLAGEGLDAAEREVLRAHVVEIVARGRAGGLWFEVMEFCELGSLGSLMESGVGLDVVEVVREIASALEFVHGLGLSQGKLLVHQDLKPENVLVRRSQPLDLVLADFGLVRVLDAALTARMTTSARGSLAYSPPEWASEVSPAWDWWSLGMITAELAAGRHPFVDASGVMLSEPQIITWLRDHPVDLSGVADPRVNLLCRGLLTKDRHHRWGAEQVGAWLTGHLPAVIDGAVAAVPTGRYRRVLFDGVEYDSAAALAVGFQNSWSEAARLLFQERDLRLVEEIERMLRAEHLDEALVLIGQPGTLREMPRRFATLLSEMNPNLQPIYNGVDLTAAGLEAAAVAVIRAAGDYPSARVFGEVREQEILTVWRLLQGMGGSAALQDEWNAVHGELETILQRLQPHGFAPSPADWGLASAWMLACLLSPAHADDLTGALRAVTTAEAMEQPWWRSLAEEPPTTATQLAAILAAPTAQLQTAEVRIRSAAAEEESRRRQIRLRREEDLATRRARVSRLEQKQGGGWFLWLLACPIGFPGIASWIPFHYIHGAVSPSTYYWELRLLPPVAAFVLVMTFRWRWFEHLIRRARHEMAALDAAA